LATSEVILSQVHGKTEDLDYSESGTATGDITLFNKVMNYNSRITGYMEWLPIG
jgi:hypothetical protein